MSVRKESFHMFGQVPPPPPNGTRWRILGFDLDSTLIRTKSGKRFPVDAQDWTWWHESVVARIAADVAAAADPSSTLVCIFTNQGGVAKGKSPLAGLQAKISAIVAQLKLVVVAAPILVCMATDDDLYRKPALGMWDFVRHEALRDAPPRATLVTRPVAWRGGMVISRRKKTTRGVISSLHTMPACAFSRPKSTFSVRRPRPLTCSIQPRHSCPRRFARCWRRR